MFFAKVAIVTLGLMPLLSAHGEQVPRQSFEITIPKVSRSVPSDGQQLLAFEVHATNLSHEPLELLKLRVRESDGGAIWASFDSVDLKGRMRVFRAGTSAASEPTTLAVGERAIVYVEFNVKAESQVHAIATELVYRATDSGIHSVVSKPCDVDQAPVIELSPPLKGGPWVAVHDPAWPNGHRRAPYTLGGQLRLPGRFAIDFVATDTDGRTSHGDPDRPDEAIGYGAPVLAGADAVVEATRDGMKESESIARNPSQQLGNGAGNYVVLKLSANRFAFYEHLRPGSVAVHPGDRVRAGQMIGSLGFTGDSTGPHLHLHVADCASPLECEGVPFTIRDMVELGRYGSLENLGLKRWDKPARGPIPPEWPGYNVVVRFPK